MLGDARGVAGGLVEDETAILGHLYVLGLVVGVDGENLGIDFLPEIPPSYHWTGRKLADLALVSTALLSITPRTSHPHNDNEHNSFPRHDSSPQCPDRR